MIDRHPILGLPLVHHLVQQRVEGFFPSMPPDVPPTDRDLGWTTRRAGRAVLAESIPHAAGDAYDDP